MIGTEAAASGTILISALVIIVLVMALVLCLCWKRNERQKSEMTLNLSNHGQDDLDGTLTKMEVNEAHVEVDNEVIHGNTSITSRNGTIQNRHDTAEQSKVDRRSGTSTGSSPRPATLNRELPDIPKQASSLDHHSILPEIPVANDGNFIGPNLPNIDGQNEVGTPDKQRKGVHSHTHLPEIPNSSYRNSSPSCHRHTVEFSPNKYKMIPHSQIDDTSSELDDYDHIEETAKKKMRPRSEYDHVVIEDGQNKVVLAKTKLQENDYAEVMNNTSTKDVTVIPVSHHPPVAASTFDEDEFSDDKINFIDDPYNRIKEDDAPYNKIREKESHDKEEEKASNKLKNDPYNRIKVDDPYNTVKDEFDDIDPYNSVNDGSSSAVSSEQKKTRTFMSKGYDPYATVMDEDRSVLNQTDPYAKVSQCDTENDLDDPYNKVIEENDIVNNLKTIPDYGDDDYATVNKVGEGQRSPSPEENHHDEYASVVKVRQVAGDASVSSVSAGNQSAENQSVTSPGLAPFRPTDLHTDRADSAEIIPPEPPRDYDDDDDSVTDRDHYNTVRLLSQTETPTDQGNKKEPPYNKLSVRESLASMNARAASNTYEYVSEVDNLYATVDGNSGDGTARPHSHVSGTDNTEKYVPAPPSLHSLHETAKQHLDEIRRKTDKSTDYCNIDNDSPNQEHLITHTRSSQQSFQCHSRTPSDHVHNKTLSDEEMSRSFEGHVPIAMEENVDLEYDPNYTDVAESKISDSNSEFDPNYETVDEARNVSHYNEVNGARKKERAIRPHIYEDPDRKRKYEVVDDVKNSDGKVRQHVYEEVKVTNESKRVRDRVLKQHTYEEVTDMKNKGDGQKQTESKTSIRNNKKDSERNTLKEKDSLRNQQFKDDKDKSKEKQKSNDSNKK